MRLVFDLSLRSSVRPPGSTRWFAPLTIQNAASVRLEIAEDLLGRRIAADPDNKVNMIVHDADRAQLPTAESGRFVELIAQEIGFGERDSNRVTFQQLHCMLVKSR